MVKLIALRPLHWRNSSYLEDLRALFHWLIILTLISYLMKIFCSSLWFALLLDQRYSHSIRLSIFLYNLFSNALPYSIWKYIAYRTNYRRRAARLDACAHGPQGSSGYCISSCTLEIHNEIYRHFDVFSHDLSESIFSGTRPCIQEKNIKISCSYLSSGSSNGKRDAGASWKFSHSLGNCICKISLIDGILGAVSISNISGKPLGSPALRIQSQCCYSWSELYLDCSRNFARGNRNWLEGNFSHPL